MFYKLIHENEDLHMTLKNDWKVVINHLSIFWCLKGNLNMMYEVLKAINPKSNAYLISPF